jgi:hypothetical protein
MTQEPENKNAVAPVIDGFDLLSTDPTTSPIRGTSIKFKDGKYYNFADLIDTKNKAYVVIDRLEGWQRLQKDNPPAYLIRLPGQPRAERPYVDQKDWPLNLNNVPEHPWRMTLYLYLMAQTGETSTFWSSTIGGRIAVDALSEQIGFMRRVRPDAVPVVALAAKEMPTQYGGTKPRPHFEILGWRRRGDGDETVSLPAPKRDGGPPVPEVIEAKIPKVTKIIGKSITPPTTAEILNDEIPPF